MTKKTLEPTNRTDITDIWAALFNMIISQGPNSKQIEIKTADNNCVKITREEYKVFRKMTYEQKKLFIECY